MSPHNIQLKHLLRSVPRVSGDEPFLYRQGEISLWCSLRERG